MLIKKDYSYIRNYDLLNNGYAEIGIYSLNFDKYFTEEEMQENKRFYETHSKDEIDKRYSDINNTVSTNMKEIMETLANKYRIYQYSSEVSYHENYDLFFWCNSNHGQPFTYFKLNTNKRDRSCDENNGLIDEIIKTIKEMNYKNVCCYIQYEEVYHDEKINQELKTICHNYEDKMITFDGIQGKIKKIDIDSDIPYGFFKKGTRKYYRNIDKNFLSLSDKGRSL